MKKYQITFLTTLLITFLSFEGLAQNKFNASIAMGSVFPLNEFRNTDLNNPEAGYSESGFTLSFDGDYYINRRFALSGRFLFGLTSLDKTKSMDWLNQQVTGYLHEDEENNKYTIGYWQWSTPLLGLKYNYPILVNQFYFETGIFTGINITPIPTQKLIILDQENQRTIISENSKKTSTSMPLMIDAGFRFSAKENIQIKLLASYYQTQTNYQHNSYIVNNNSSEINETIQTSALKIPLKTLHFSIGVVYSL